MRIKFMIILHFFTILIYIPTLDIYILYILSSMKHHFLLPAKIVQMQFFLTESNSWTSIPIIYLYTYVILHLCIYSRYIKTENCPLLINRFSSSSVECRSLVREARVRISLVPLPRSYAQNCKFFFY